MHRVPLAQREYLVVRVVGKTPRPAETTTRHCQSGSEGRSFGADPDRRFLGLCYGVQTRSLASCLRHQPRQEPRALTRMRGSVRGDWRKPVPYRDGARHAESPKKRNRYKPLTHNNIILSIVYFVDCLALQANHITRLFITGFLQILRWHPIASMVTIAPLIFSSSSNSGMTVISLDLSSTLRCPRTSFWSQAQAETMWMAAWLELETNDRRRVFPSAATTPSSVSFRLATQLMKQLWNTSISSRENRIPS